MKYKTVNTRECFSLTTNEINMVILLDRMILSVKIYETIRRDDACTLKKDFIFYQTQFMIEFQNGKEAFLEKPPHLQQD